MKDAGPTAAALLIECRANGPEGLQVSPSFTPVCNELAACDMHPPLLMLSMSECAANASGGPPWDYLS
jgi:hypothetical protein